MNLNGLLHLLDIENPLEFEYFEQYAELAETEEDIAEDVFVEFFRDVDAGALRELTESYFEEVLTGVPDSQTDLFLLLTSIGRVLNGFANASDGYEARRSYAEEFYRFRLWYIDEDLVAFVTTDRAEDRRCSVLEALAVSRAEVLSGKGGGTEQDFDFSDALHYEIDEYMVPIEALVDDEDGDDLPEDVLYDDEM